MGNIGNARLALGDIQEAIGCYESALLIVRKIGARQREGTTLYNLGRAWGNLGHTHKAVDYFDAAQTIARDVGDRLREAQASFYSAIARDKLGQREDALRLAEHALNLYTAIESATVEKVREQIAEWRKAAS